jgi:hypothetical protein
MKKYTGSQCSKRALVVFLILFSSGSVIAQNQYDFIKEEWLQFTDAPNSLYHYMAGQAYDYLASRSSEISQIKDLDGWKKRQAYVRKTLLDIVGPFPPKTPLNAVVTRVIKRDTIRIEHILYESQPGFIVTSTLFIPGNLKKNAKAPAIIYCSGHSEDGYRSPVYQHVILNLVKKGFVVFAFDPVGQGERLEYYDPKSGKSMVGGPTTEHSYPGTQAFIIGSSQARYMIWDGIRAVDYLLTRKEVDPARIGITGRSGGGTQSACISAMDDRILAAAPECYLTTFTRLFQTMGNQDAEQNLFNEICRGLDLADLIEVRAPKPELMITTTRDIFNIQGAIETEKEASVIYKAYAKPECFGRAEDDTIHASTWKNREAMYAFFQKFLDNPGSPRDEAVEILAKDEIRVTPTGQVSVSPGSETVFSLNKKEALRLEEKLNAFRSSPGYTSEKVLESAKRLSGYKSPSLNDEPVFAGRHRRSGYVVEKYFVKGEGRYIIPYLLLIPDGKCKGGILYLNPDGKSADASESGSIVWLVRQGYAVLAPDIIGTGETGPGIFKGDAYIEGGSHNLFYAAVLTGRSLVGIRASDVVKLSALIKNKLDITEIKGIALRELSPVLVYAAAFDRSITGIALIDPYSSYMSMVLNRFYISAFVPGAVPGALKEYDLPDLEACLAPRALMMCGVTDGNGKKEDRQAIDSDLSIIRKVYKEKGAEKNLLIRELPDEKGYEGLLGEWLEGGRQ